MKYDSQVWINSCHDEFILGNIKMNLHFLSFLNTEMGQVVEILPHGRQRPVYPAVDITVADDLATIGARASAAMVST